MMGSKEKGFGGGDIKQKQGKSIDKNHSIISNGVKKNKINNYKIMGMTNY